MHIRELQTVNCETCFTFIILSNPVIIINTAYKLEFESEISKEILAARNSCYPHLYI